MEDKIAALSNVLPRALVENRATYSILSFGIHELDEDTCRKYFPVVRKAIITILEQDLNRKRELQQQEELKKEISRITSEVRRSPQSK